MNVIFDPQTDWKLANQIPNKHPSNKENKGVDACAIDAKIKQITLKTTKFAGNN